MENKTDAVRREILKSIIDRYASKGRKILISKVKEAGVYKHYVSDDEVYGLIVKFAEFHNIPIDFSKTVLSEKIIEEPKKEKINNDDYFLSVCKKEHDLLSKKLLYLNKIISSYETPSN